MKIGMILDAEFPPDPRVENEALTLIKEGFEVHLFCLDYKNKTDSIEEYRGIHVYRKSCSALIYKLSALAYTIPVYHFIVKKWIANFILKTGVNCLHVHDIQVARAAIGFRSDDFPVILDLHENRPEIMKYYVHLNTLMGKLLIWPRIWKKFEAKYIRDFDQTLVVTEEAKEYYIREYSISPEKIISLPNTVRSNFEFEYNIDDEIIGKNKDKFTLLYVGDTGLRRGLLTAIESLSILISSIPNVNLVIVGSNKTDFILKNKVTELGLENYVDFEGWKDFSYFQSYITASQICISPLHKNIHHDTTYANKIFQYMAMAKPLLVSNCDAQENIVNSAKCGYVFEDKNVADFANKVITLYGHKELREEFGKQGQIFIKDVFSWEEKSKPFVELYKKISSNEF